MTLIVVVVELLSLKMFVFYEPITCYRSDSKQDELLVKVSYLASWTRSLAGRCYFIGPRSWGHLLPCWTFLSSTNPHLHFRWGDCRLLSAQGIDRLIDSTGRMHALHRKTKTQRVWHQKWEATGRHSYVCLRKPSFCGKRPPPPTEITSMSMS